MSTLFGNLNAGNTGSGFQSSNGPAGGLFSGGNAGNNSSLFTQQNNNPSNGNSLFSFDKSKNPPNTGNNQLLGNTNSNNNSLFGNNINSNNTNTTGLFGTNGQKPNNNIFGNPSSGNQTGNTGIIFGANSNDNNPLFGTNTTKVPTTTQSENKSNNNLSLFNNNNPLGNPNQSLFSNIQNQETKNNAANGINLSSKDGGVSFGFSSATNTSTFLNNPPASKEDKKDNNAFSLFNKDTTDNNKESNTNGFLGFNNTDKKKEEENANVNKDNKIQFGLINAQNQEQKKGDENKKLGQIFNNTDNTLNEQKKDLFNATSQKGVENKENKENNENKININPSNIANNVDNNAPKNDNNIINNNEDKEYQIINNIPEPFHFSDCKELTGYEKNQLLHMTNGEIIEDLKNMLKNQQEKFKECTENSRKLESKHQKLIKINHDNNKYCQINQRKGDNLLSQLNSLNERYKTMQKAIEFIDNKMTGVLEPYKDNIMNSDNILFSQNNSEKFKFYEDFMKISKKCHTIENNLNEAENSLNKTEKEIADISNRINNNNGNLGIWVERPNNKKIFVSQNEMNSMLTECYDGLMNLKSMQDNIDNKYEILKKNILKGMGQNSDIY